jgi:hypothetical protein
MNLLKASNQWATRPSDERFWNLDEMREACYGYAKESFTQELAINDCQVLSRGNELLLTRNHDEARMTNWAFGQLATTVGAPAGYLRQVDGELAADCLNYGLSKLDGDLKRSVLFQQNGEFLVRSLNGPNYSRIWNYEVVDRVREHLPHGWRIPPARPATPKAYASSVSEGQFNGSLRVRKATEADVLPGGGSLSVRVGDLIAPAGLYASDHDCFIFMVNEENRIQDGTPEGLARGFFLSNSEVGAGAFKVTKFLYRHVCGNHIVWDAKDVSELRLIHTGNANQVYGGEFRAELTQYSEQGATADENRIKSAKECILGVTKDEVLDVLFGKRVLPLKKLEQAYEYAERDADQFRTNPRSAWGMAQGVTYLSQEARFADERNELDRAAGKVLLLAN